MDSESGIPSLPLGGSDGTVRIPQLGFGVWQIPEDDIEMAVGTALDAGYRHIDTAKVYDNEAGVGRALAASGLAPGSVFVTTKLWNSDQMRVRDAFEGSMARLGLPVLDLYLIHWPVPKADAYVEAWQEMRALRDEGRIRAVGVCNFQIAHLERLAQETGERPAVNQIELHPYLQQRELREYHAAHGIVTESWSPLASGKHVLDDPVVKKVAGKHGVTPAQAILRWHLQLGCVVFPKSVTPQRIRENIDLWGFTLDEEDLADMESLDRGLRTGPDPDRLSLGRAR